MSRYLHYTVQPPAASIQTVTDALHARFCSGVTTGLGYDALTPMLSTPTDLALDQWLGSSKINLSEHTDNLLAAKYSEVADLLGASEEELADLIAKVGMEPPEERRLRAGISRENKKRKLAKKNAAMIKELEDRIMIRQVLAGSVIVIFDILPPPSIDSKDQVIDDDELFGGDHDLVGVGMDIIVGCFEQFFEPPRMTQRPRQHRPSLVPLAQRHRCLSGST